MAIESERLLTVKEVAERLRVHPITVRRLIASGRLPAVRIGRAVRVREAQIESIGRLQSNIPSGLAYRQRLTKDELHRRRKAVEELLAFRDSLPPLGCSTDELLRESRRELEQRANRWLKP